MPAFHSDGIGPDHHKYLAMSGKHWIERLDHDPAIKNTLKENNIKCYFKASKCSRFTGPNQRMILTTPNRKAIMIFKRRKSILGYYGIQCILFVNNSVLLSSELINDALNLVFLQWPEQIFYVYIDSKKYKIGSAGFWFEKAGCKLVHITTDGIHIYERSKLSHNTR